MGKIEEIIYENYKSAIAGGDLEQAKRAIELAQVLKSKIEVEEFQDYDSLKVPNSLVLGRFFNQFPYVYDHDEGIIELSTSVINLSKTENKLFKLFSDNETQGKSIKIVTSEHIKKHMWPGKFVTSNAVRISILRLRRRVEIDPKNPQILIGIHSKGYAFLGNKVTRI